MIASKAKSIFKKLLLTWAAIVVDFPKTVLSLAILFTVVAGWYSVSHLGVITDTAVMLSDKLHYLKVYRHFKRQFPHSYNQIVIVIDGETPDLAISARDRLADILKKNKKLFHWVFAPGGDEFFKKNGLLFLSVDKLEELSDTLSKAQPFLARLVDETDLHGLFSTLELAVENYEKSKGFDLEKIFDELNRTFRSFNSGSFYQMSWIRLMSGHSAPSSRQFIIVQPGVSYNTVLPGKEAISTIKRLVKQLQLGPERGVEIMLTGDIPMEYDELKSVTKGAKMAGILSIIMVTIVLVTGLGSVRLVFATLVPLAAGLVWTACFAAIAIGHLNMISVAFAVLFIGLGVDYAIHLCLRYRELISSGYPSKKAILASIDDVGPSLMLCAITTSIGFLSFMPTDFSGVAELGLISGVGMFIALFANITLLTATISLLPLNKTHKRPYYVTSKTHPGLTKITSLPFTHSRFIRVLAIFTTFVAFFAVPKVKFDSNPMNLRDPNSESIIAFKKLLTDPNSSPWSLQSLAGTKKEAEEKIAKFKALSSVRHVISLESFVPKDQDEKLEIIQDIEFILGDFLDSDIEIIKGDYTRELTAISSFKNSLKKLINSHLLGGDLKRVSLELLHNIDIFLKRLNNSPDDKHLRLIDKLRQMLLGSFPERMEELGLALSAEPVTEKDIPEEIRQQWIGLDGSRRIEIVPKENPRSDSEIIAFVQAARAIDPNVTGYPVLIIEGGRAVVRAFVQAFTYSSISSVLLLIFLMPHKLDAVLILYSLFFSSLMTAALMVVLGIDLNFANIIALPLILGIGVDNGIHIVHRFRRSIENPVSLLQTSTARGIFFSTLTTICSFGNLAISPHQGMASMGKLLTIGISMALLSAIVIIPAFLSGIKNRQIG